MNFFCRVCENDKVEKFKYSSINFPTNNSYSTNKINCFCKKCFAVSHFNDENFKTDYSGGGYRKKDLNENKSQKYYKGIFPPIALPWSHVTFLRWINIAKLLEKTEYFNNLSTINHLDYGGYNGLLSYALNKYFNFGVMEMKT